MDLPVDLLQVLHIVQHEVGQHQVKGMLWEGVRLQGAHLVSNVGIHSVSLSLGDHFLAAVNAQDLGCAHLRSMPAVPSIAAPHIQYALSLYIREQLTELVPLPGGVQPADAPVHLGIRLEKRLIVVYALQLILYLPVDAAQQS